MKTKKMIKVVRGKPVTLKKRTLLDRRKEQEVKNEKEDIGQASMGKPSTINSGVFDCSNSWVAALRSWTSSSTGGQN